MIVCDPARPQELTPTETDASPYQHRQYSQNRQQGQCQGRQKLDRRQWWFFFGLAPLAVLVGWTMTAICLTGNWAWEWPSGLLLALIGSSAAMFGNLFRFP